VLWTDDPADYATPPAKVLMTRTIDWAHNGGIILIHDGLAETVKLLPQLLQALRARGFEFVTIDQMLQAPGHE
jgi:peptidoglycan/xylan/chitin deacetylase (PgdA/CDA1 family)